jgi:hypothetical protein
LFLDFSQDFRGKGSLGWILKKDLGECHHLIAFCPAVFSHSTLTGFDQDAHAEIRVLSGREWNDANVLREFIEAIDREN